MKERPPVVCLLLIAANLFAAFLTLYDPGIVERFGFDASRPTVVAAFASLFLHQNTIHLLGNMVFLAAVGPAVEGTAGSGRFFLVYVASGLLGVATHWLFARQAVEPAALVGASGCVAGCVSYYAVRFARVQVPVAPRITVSIGWVVAGWAALQALGAVVRLGDGSGGTAFWAHLGGLAGGLVLSLAYRVPRLSARDEGREVVRAMRDRSPGAALASAEVVLRHDPDHTEAGRQRIEALESLGEKEDLVEAVLAVLRKQPRECERCLARLANLGALDRVEPLKRTLYAERFKESSPDLSRALLASVLDGGADDGQRPDALLALAGLERDRAPERAQTLLRELIERYPLHPATTLARNRGWAK
ncbi:MAG: rhomboid family intramembrane serine protease [Fimbriimonadaceae bacterium]|nr:rhomboid family intramembrane serine protease [Fimbriimonadaceae bacterium]